VLFAGLLAGALPACTRNAGSAGKKLRLHVGEVREITLRAPADTALRLRADSENKEVVDVSERETVATTPSSKRSTFLFKGVTAGSARVVVAEKPAFGAGPDRVRRAYRVEVVNR
jgi:hypothetical protein